MTITRMRFYAWGKFFAQYDKARVQAWLRIIGDGAETAFRNGVNGPHTGVVGRRKNGTTFIRSAEGEYPARDSGALINGTKVRQTPTTVVIGTDVKHATYLTHGTTRMAPRRMYKEAMQESVASAAKNLKGFAKWKGVEAWKRR